MVAPGSRPYHPEEIDFTHPRVFDSDTVLRMTFMPRSLLIYGAGVVGCEFASLFRNLGVKVDLVNTRDRLLSFLDDEITDALAYHLRDKGVLIRNNEECERVELADDVGEPCDLRFVELIPTGIYTSPEISSVGKTERELTEEKVPYEVGHSHFGSLARAQITGETVGMLKLLFHRETLALLGVHCFGHQAAEIVHIGQGVMAQPATANTVAYFANTTFNYPTMAEAYRVAALNGAQSVVLNRLRPVLSRSLARVGLRKVAP